MEFMPPSNSDYTNAEYVIIPLPFGDKASWKGGAENGPKAILEASAELEYYDIQTGFDISMVKHYTMPPLLSRSEIQPTARRIFKDGKFPLFLGGDHSVSIPIFREIPEEVSILHFDAHLDMRAEYMGDPESHACALYEASKNHRVVQVGIRSGSREDVENAQKFGNLITNETDEILANLGDKVYITFDVDAFDPSIIPATGTPEPDGLTWGYVNRLLARVFNEKRVVGMDIVELAPREGLHYAEATIAKLMFKVMYYHYGGQL